MNKTAIAFSTRDRVDLSKQTVEPLLQPDKFDLFWSDGSETDAGLTLPLSYKVSTECCYVNVKGGADAAIVFNLTTLLNHPNNYAFLGLCENDVLLDEDWFAATLALFEKGKQDGLEVGAVSSRSYVDRILFQRDGYGVCHNLGAGQVIFTRQAARLVLESFRTDWTLKNRRTFARLTGEDIGPWWAFRGSAHMLCADWSFDRVLAEHGLASLALTPAKCQMIGQDPPLEKQGLKLTTGPVEARVKDAGFQTYAANLKAIRDGELRMPDSKFYRDDNGNTTYFPHQIEQIGGRYEGDWKLRWVQGFGPFVWEVRGSAFWEDEFNQPKEPKVTIPVSGPCIVLVSGGKSGGTVQVVDEASGYENTIKLDPEGNGQVMQLQVPSAVSYRNIRVIALSPGVTFYGLIAREPQVVLPNVSFDHSKLPSP